MHIPTASALVRGGYFLRRPETGLYDTPLSAQSILRSMAAAHGKRLSTMRISAGEAPPGIKADGSLLDLVNAGLASDSNVRGSRSRPGGFDNL